MKFYLLIILFYYINNISCYKLDNFIKSKDKYYEINKVIVHNIYVKEPSISIECELFNNIITHNKKNKTLLKYCESLKDVKLNKTNNYHFNKTNNIEYLFIDKVFESSSEHISEHKPNAYLKKLMIVYENKKKEYNDIIEYLNYMNSNNQTKIQETYYNVIEYINALTFLIPSSNIIVSKTNHTNYYLFQYYLFYGNQYEVYKDKHDLNFIIKENEYAQIDLHNITVNGVLNKSEIVFNSFEKKLTNEYIDTKIVIICILVVVNIITVLFWKCS